MGVLPILWTTIRKNFHDDSVVTSSFHQSYTEAMIATAKTLKRKQHEKKNKKKKRKKNKTASAPRFTVLVVRAMSKTLMGREIVHESREPAKSQSETSQSM